LGSFRGSELDESRRDWTKLFSFDSGDGEAYGHAMKQFIIIVLAILVSAGIIGIAIGIYQAKQDHDAFEQKIKDSGFVPSNPN
jgi:hypothetical protein